MIDKKEPVKKVSPRHRARECAVQALYSWALSGNAPEQVELTFVVDQDLKGVDKPYFSRLFRKPLNVKSLFQSDLIHPTCDLNNGSLKNQRLRHSQRFDGKGG